MFNHRNTQSILRIEHLVPTKDLSPSRVFNTASYSVDMYEDTIAMAFNAGSEFATVDDIQSRIRAFQSASLEVGGSHTLSVNVVRTEVGQFSLKIK